MKKISRLVVLLASFGVPLLAVAQTGINTSYITPYSTGIIGVINGILVPVLMAIAFIVFLWGVYKYFILGASDEKSRTDGRQFTLWGVIGFVVIVSLWGLVNLIMGTLGLQAGVAAPPFPTIGGGSYSATGGGGTMSAAQNSALSSCQQSGSSISSACTSYNAAYTSSTGGTSAGYGSGTAACTPPEVQSPEGGCYTPLDQTFDAQTYCINNGGIWLNGQCDDPQTYCINNGGIWANGQCDDPQTYCINNGGIWANGQCDDPQTYCTNNGGTWENGSCN